MDAQEALPTPDPGLVRQYEQAKKAGSVVTSDTPKRLPGESEHSYQERLRLFTSTPSIKLAAATIPRR